MCYLRLFQIRSYPDANIISSDTLSVTFFKISSANILPKCLTPRTYIYYNWHYRGISEFPVIASSSFTLSTLVLLERPTVLIKIL